MDEHELPFVRGLSATEMQFAFLREIRDLLLDIRNELSYAREYPPHVTGAKRLPFDLYGSIKPKELAGELLGSKFDELLPQDES